MATRAPLADDLFRAALWHPLVRTDFPALGEKYEGKVRDNYTRGDERVIIATDRISAFDRVLGTLPFKGQILNAAATWWFEQTRKIAPNHVLRVPDPCAVVAQQCTPLPVEMVVRAYLTGTTSTSIWVHYENGARTFAGHALPDGLKRHQKLPEVLLTPSTKAAHGGHDVSTSRDEILALTNMPSRDFDEAARLSLDLFAYGQKVCAERGLILVDTKYEFGKTVDGRIVVIDEVHTPDSSRFWYSSSYESRFRSDESPESFDKEFVRRYLKEQGFSGDGPIPEIPASVKIEASRRYIEALETITGSAFVPDVENPTERLARNLGLT
jgi:phosphoribosylaminoimidazole-succinocarboxamide synthase